MLQWTQSIFIQKSLMCIRNNLFYALLMKSLSIVHVNVWCKHNSVVISSNTSSNPETRHFHLTFWWDTAFAWSFIFNFWSMKNAYRFLALQIPNSDVTWLLWPVLFPCFVILYTHLMFAFTSTTAYTYKNLNSA